EISARVISHAKVFHTEQTGHYSYSTPSFGAGFAVPSDLALGPAEMEVRIRANGVVGDPTTELVSIVDPVSRDQDPTLVAPRIMRLAPARVGIGQAIELAVEDRRSLDPDPSKVVVILEQGSTRVEITPELNFAALRGSRSMVGPTVLVARVGDDITGEAVVRVSNPGRPGAAGLSEGEHLTIVDHVLPPKLTAVREATDSDLRQLRLMREMALKAGRMFKDYDPKCRYLAIEAEGMDYNPNYLVVEFEQGGKSYTLTYDDFSLSMGNLRVVRLPDSIGPGPLKVTVTNRGGDRLSQPASIVAEITSQKR